MPQLALHGFSKLLGDQMADSCGCTQVDYFDADKKGNHSLKLTFDEPNAYISMQSEDVVEGDDVSEMVFLLLVHALDVFPILQCIIVFIKQKISLLEEQESDIMTALHEAVLNALVHGNLAQESHYNSAPQMFDHFVEISDLIMSGKEPQKLMLKLEFEHGQLAVTVRDEGRGFSKDALVTPGESALHGRGMSIIKECCDSVDVLGGGQTIVMYFSHSGGARFVSERLAQAHILVVEDVEMNRVIIKEMLKRRGFKNISTAVDGVDAYEKTLKLRPDLVLLDIVLPKMDGYTYCRNIRKNPELREMPVVVQTVLSQPEQRSKAFACGASDLVTKPINGYELVSRITLLLEKKVLLNDLQQYQQRVQSELNTAFKMQRSIMPDAKVLNKIKHRYGLAVESIFQPCSEIGGDLWGTLMVSDSECAFYVVDFSGHGVSAALNAFRFQAMLQSLVVDMADPAAVLQELNLKLRAVMDRGQFATMFYAVLDASKSTLSYAAAGSTQPAVVRARAEVEWLNSRGIPLSAADNPIYKNQETAFGESDALLLYSDALIETANKAGGFLLQDELEQELIGKPYEDCFSGLLQSFDKHNSAPLQDDLTMALVFRN